MSIGWRRNDEEATSVNNARLSLWIIAALMLIASAGASGQNGNIQVNADVAVTLSATPNTDLVPGQVVDVTATVSNNGPGDADVLSMRTSDILPLLQFVYGSSDCSVHTLTYVNDQDVPFAGILQWDEFNVDPPFFGPGRTIQCHFKVIVLPTAPNRFAVTLGVPFINDIDATNDTSILVMTLRPKAELATVPALTYFDRYFLIVLVAAAAVLKWRTRRAR